MYGNIIKESYIIKWYRKHSYQKKTCIRCESVHLTLHFYEFVVQHMSDITVFG